jgi:hypothetical protein
MHLKEKLSPEERAQAKKCLLEIAEVMDFDLMEFDPEHDGGASGTTKPILPIDRRMMGVSEDFSFCWLGLAYIAQSICL